MHVYQVASSDSVWPFPFLVKGHAFDGFDALQNTGFTFLGNIEINAKV